MSFPLLPPEQLGLVVAVLVGFGFGFVLERAGFGRAQKLAAQFYGTDLTVFKVMFSAIVTAMLGATVASLAGLVDFRALADQVTSATYLWPMIVGGLLLGVGFIVSGYCPGTSFVAVASGKIDGLATVVGVVLGQLAWAGLEWRAPFARFHESGNLGNLYLWELFHLPSRVGPPVVALAVTAMAVGCFLGAERIERLLAARGHPAALPTPAGRPGRLVLAGFAAVALVALAGLALPAGTRASAREPARISALDLARRVFDEPWRLRVLDLRDRAACAAKRIPGSECVPAADLPTLALAEAAAGPDLVLVAEGDLAEVPPPASGYPGRVRILAGGWGAWEDLSRATPPPPGASAADLDDYRVRAAVRSALTGVKAAPPPPPAAASPGVRRKAGGGCSG